MFSRAPVCFDGDRYMRMGTLEGRSVAAKRPRGGSRDVRGSSIQFRSVISPYPLAGPSPAALSRSPPSVARESTSLALPRSPAMAIPPPVPRRRDTATDSDASARRRSITPSSAPPTSRASSRLRGIGDATRGVALSATSAVTPCVLDGSAAQQRSGATRISRANTRACDLGHSRRDPPQTRDVHPRTTEKSRVPNRGPTHDMAKVSPRNERGMRERGKKRGTKK